LITEVVLVVEKVFKRTMGALRGYVLNLCGLPSGQSSDFTVGGENDFIFDGIKKDADG
jgi:hypothetical protein